ncbi:MAG TPA: zf-HC2 domain-containing protein [Candidatus Acidoferrum sp.]|nr:zf-HC2 domain-containing protein [Candidatus Acidoferrum sp.]
MNAHPNHDLLIDYLHGELAPGEDAALSLHLDSCTDCRARYEGEVELSESLRAYARLSERELPAGVRNAVWAAIEASERRPAWLQRVAAWLHPAIAFPVAAALVLGAFLGFGVSAHHSGTMIDAAYYLDDHAAVTSAVPFNEGNTVPAALFTTENADGAQ